MSTPAERRIRWFRAMVGLLVTGTATGLVIGAMQIEERGPAFFLFRNTGAGAGNLRNLTEVQGPHFTAVQRASMNNHIMLAALLILPVCGVFLGRWIALRQNRMDELARKPAVVIKPAPAPVPAPTPLLVPVWERAGFYSQTLAVVAGRTFRGNEDSYDTQLVPIVDVILQEEEVAAAR